MAFPNTLFPLISLDHTEITNEEYKLFHTIDIMLVKKLIHSFNGTFNDAIDVVAFLLWLEREKLSVNAVYKVLKEWPNHLVGILVEQVVALLKWLGNTQLVWERRGDIFLIQELCHDDVVTFIYLYQRRFEILEGKHLIKSEMTERAFGEMFPREPDNRNVQDGVGLGIGARVGVRNVGDGAAYGSQNVVNRNNIGVPGPQEVLLDNNVGRVGLGIGRGVGFQNIAGGLVYDPREWSHGNQIRIQFGSIDGPQELESDFAVASAVQQLQNIDLGRAESDVSRRYIHDPRRIMNVNHYGVGAQFAAGSPVHLPQTVRTFVPGHLQYATNHNLLSFGTISDAIQGDQSQIEHVVNDGGIGGIGGGFANEASSNNDRILPNIPYGPRMRYMGTNGQIQRSDQVNTRRPIPESELHMLLRGLNIEDEETDVPEDDRTVFLTFSRGDPLTEPEIWAFFTRYV